MHKACQQHLKGSHKSSGGLDKKVNSAILAAVAAVCVCSADVYYSICMYHGVPRHKSKTQSRLEGLQ